MGLKIKKMLIKRGAEGICIVSKRKKRDYKTNIC